MRAADKLPGVTFGIALADGSVFALASGEADTSRHIAMRPTDRMLEGSVGKTYVAAVAMQLVAEGNGNKQIARGTVTEVNDDYSVAEMTMLDESAVKYKTLVLVATDVTDNYIMIIGTPETEFSKNKDTLDAIWGSF